MMQFRKYSIELYSELGLFNHVGSLRVASSREQLKELERSVSRARGIGMDVEMISPSEALKIMPQLSGEDLYGAIYLPRDGHLDPYGTTTGMARVVREMGVAVYTDMCLTGLELSPKGEIRKIMTNRGAIRTNLVVNAAGLWAPRIAAMAGVYLPTTPVDHQHIAVKAVAGHEFPKNTPCLRDPDNLVYMREEQGGLVIGGYEPNPLARWIDGAQIERVFLNLIINAAEAMSGNGTLTLTTTYGLNARTIEIEVKDTGHGISIENMERIFNPFFTTKEIGHGVGLGLAISYGIVKEHNGEITVESETGKGARFIVNLPIIVKVIE